MWLTLGIIGSIIAYILMGALTWGHCCAFCAGLYNEKYNEGRDPEYYHDEPEPFFAAVFWPIYLTIVVVLGRACSFLAEFGEQRVAKSFEKKRVRIELKKNLEKEQEEIVDELEESLKENSL